MLFHVLFVVYLWCLGSTVSFAAIREFYGRRIQLSKMNDTFLITEKLLVKMDRPDKSLPSVIPQLLLDCINFLDKEDSVISSSCNLVLVGGAHPAPCVCPPLGIPQNDLQGHSGSFRVSVTSAPDLRIKVLGGGTIIL